MIYKLDSSGLKSVSPGVNILEKKYTNGTCTSIYSLNVTPEFIKKVIIIKTKRARRNQTFETQNKNHKSNIFTQHIYFFKLGNAVFFTVSYGC